MKRSQMVGEISKVLSKCFDTCEDYWYLYDEEARIILTKLETLGMLPPQTCKIIYDEKGPKHNEATRQWDKE